MGEDDAVRARDLDEGDILLWAGVPRSVHLPFYVEPQNGFAEKVLFEHGFGCVEGFAIMHLDSSRWLAGICV